jgi:radical S-adenosyl methionine domain-containing protein 2
MKVKILNNSQQEFPCTINIHLTRSCNFNCQFCYAGFGECGSSHLPPDQLRQILYEISRVQSYQNERKIKVNFAGGETLLYPALGGILGFCKQLGLTTSLVTNGFLLDESMVDQFSGALDICAISMDSGLPETNHAIGRCTRDFRPDALFYRSKVGHIHGAGIRLKVNTVVNRLNLHENLAP